MLGINQQRIFPTIDLGEYILREKQESDLQDFFNYYTDPKVNQYIVSYIPQNLEEARLELKFWQNVFYSNDGIYFAIARKDNNQLIGSLGFSGYIRHHNRVELSYDLSKDYWRQGITNKAINAIVKYGFETMNFNRIEAFTVTENIASEKLLEKCGFKKEGLLRQHRFHKQKYIDVYIFSLIKEDYLKNTNQL
jgi:ribosomal-protein-alanine N-acetyltransferase